MYHEEKIIEGILHYRYLSDDKWREYSPEALTILLTAERTKAIDFEDKLNLYIQKMAASAQKHG